MCILGAYDPHEGKNTILFTSLIILLRKPVMQLSQKERNLSTYIYISFFFFFFLFAFWKSRFNFEHFQQKDDSHS